MQLPKAYEPKNYEDQIYKNWEASGTFKPQARGSKERYSIALPPPNATGSLHLGHVVMLAVQDAIIRYQRMLGKETLWLPGTDHAAIATENVVIKQLEKEGIEDPRKQLGREELVKRIAAYVETSRSTIRNQTRKMGASLDWSRERYTLDESLNRLVNEVFVKMYTDGLIYRGQRIVNWDPNLRTTVSDDEVERKEEQAPLFTLQYGPFQIATARPETKFGDKYVVMHPDDKRYAKYKHGQTFTAEWINGTVQATVIKDKAIDPEFGTGVMTITPWHDATDFEIAERNKLAGEQIIGFDGKLLPIAGEEFMGMDIAAARPKIVEKMRAKKLLISVDENYHHNIALNSRGKGVIEPQIMQQWFVDVNKPAVTWKGKKMSLKKVMASVVEDGDVTIIPKRFEKVYFHWINNLRDWCISRQIWWGHRIPVWYKGKETYVGTQPPKGSGYIQDEDTLDTWFSSALWTWSTLVDPDSTKDYKLSLQDLLDRSPDFQRFHPTNLLETGYDILFFWVARMILATTYATGQVPFYNVYLHGLVRTRDGRKMSKSEPETMIDPLEIIPEYGADSLRLAMVIGQTPGNDSRLYKEKIAGYRNFNNKLWNVARYVLSTIGDNYQPQSPKPKSHADEWMLGKLNAAITKISASIEAYRLSDAGQTIYSLLWDEFADWYVEASKVQPNPDVLFYGLETILKLAHPFAPFVTEALWSQLPARSQQLIISPWPNAPKYSTQKAAEFDEVKAIISEIRAIKADLELPQVSLYFKGSGFLNDNAALITKLAGITGVEQVSQGEGLPLASTAIDCWLGVDHETISMYAQTLKKKQTQAKAYADGLAKQLANKQFVSSAPKEVVSQTKQRLEEANSRLDTLNQQLSQYDA